MNFWHNLEETFCGILIGGLPGVIHQKIKLGMHGETVLGCLREFYRCEELFQSYFWNPAKNIFCGRSMRNFLVNLIREIPEESLIKLLEEILVDWTSWKNPCGVKVYNFFLVE